MVHTALSCAARNSAVHHTCLQRKPGLSPRHQAKRQMRRGDWHGLSANSYASIYTASRVRRGHYRQQEGALSSALAQVAADMQSLQQAQKSDDDAQTDQTLELLQIFTL